MVAATQQVVLIYENIYLHYIVRVLRTRFASICWHVMMLHHRCTSGNSSNLTFGNFIPQLPPLFFTLALIIVCQYPCEYVFIFSMLNCFSGMLASLAMVALIFLFFVFTGPSNATDKVRTLFCCLICSHALTSENLSR